MWIDGHVHLTRPVTRLLDEMQRWGISRAVVCSSTVARGEEISTLEDALTLQETLSGAHLQQSPLSVRKINEQFADDIRPYGDRLLGMGKIDLRAGNLEEQMNDVVALNFYGVGEVLGVHQNVQAMEPVFSYSQTHGNLPVFVHCDSPVDGDDLRALIELAASYPGSKLIVGHLGGEHWIEAIQLAREVPGCRLDISEVSNTIPIRVACREIPEKLLFGSDYPWDSPAVNRQRLNGLNLEPDILEAILGGNLLAFYELE